MEWLSVIVDVLTVVGGSAVVAAALPAKVAKYLGPLMSVIDCLGANLGRAKNKE